MKLSMRSRSLRKSKSSRSRSLRKYRGGGSCGQPKPTQRKLRGGGSRRNTRKVRRRYRGGGRHHPHVEKFNVVVPDEEINAR